MLRQALIKMDQVLGNTTYLLSLNKLMNSKIRRQGTCWVKQEAKYMLRTILIVLASLYCLGNQWISILDLENTMLIAIQIMRFCLLKEAIYHKVREDLFLSSLRKEYQDLHSTMLQMNLRKFLSFSMLPRNG
jgi:hypothetical protein